MHKITTTILIISICIASPLDAQILIDSQADELETAFKELQHYRNGTSEMLTPATTIRNVLQHFKGELYFIAKNTDKEKLEEIYRINVEGDYELSSVARNLKKLIKCKDLTHYRKYYPF